jgi:hypothetical protein
MGDGESLDEMPGRDFLSSVSFPQAVVPDKQTGSVPPGTCVACLTVPCSWKAAADVGSVTTRKVEVEKELFRVRRIADPGEEPGADPFAEPLMIKSDVVLSYLRGGPVRQPRLDLVFELTFELQGLRSMLRLNDIDRELHAIYAAPKDEFVSTQVLHGYPAQLWRGNALIQLEAESSRIVSRQIVGEVLSDILDWMYEGWYFGEIKSAASLAGYVAVMNKARALRPFEGSSAAAAIYAEQGPAARARAADAARGLLPLHSSNAGSNAAAISALARYSVGVQGMFGSLLDPEAAGEAASALGGPAREGADAVGGSQTVISLLMTTMAPEGQQKRGRGGKSRAYEVGQPGLDTPGARSAQPSALSSLGASRQGGEGEGDDSVMEIFTSGAATGAPPSGFYRVDDPVASARMRTEIAAQDMLHTFLVHGGAELGAAASKVAGGVAAGAHAPKATGGLFSALPASAKQIVSVVPSAGGPGLTDALVRAGAGVMQGKYASTASLALAMAALHPSALGAGMRVTQSERDAGRGYEVAARVAVRTAIATTASVLESLDVTETTLRYGMFLLALTYFRIMNQLSRLKAMLAGDADASGLTGGTPDVGMAPKTRVAMTAERARMVAQEKLVLKRETAKAMSNARAAAGFAARASKAAAIAEEERTARAKRFRRAARDNNAAITIQRTLRGYRVRVTLEDFKRRKKAHDEYQALRHFAATRVQSQWRAWMAQQVVRQRRAELTDYLRYVRAGDAEEAMVEYYAQNPLKNFLKARTAGAAITDATYGVAAVRLERLLDDDVIKERMAAAAGPSASNKAVEEAGGLAGIVKFGNLAAAEEALNLDARDTRDDVDLQDAQRPINLDALGKDDPYYGIVQPGAGYKPVGTAGLRKLLAAPMYSTASAPAMKAIREAEVRQAEKNREAVELRKEKQRREGLPPLQGAAARPPVAGKGRSGALPRLTPADEVAPAAAVSSPRIALPSLKAAPTGTVTVTLPSLFGAKK